MNLETVFFESVAQQHALWIVLLAFAGGVVSSILPCTLGMMPILVGYIGGYGATSKKNVAIQAAVFTLGIAVVMTLLGVGAALLGLTFGSWLGSGWYYAIGGVVILMGLQLLGVFHLPMPQVLQQLPDVSQYQGTLTRWVAPFLLGMAFGITASPCGTPYLAAILGLISHGQNVVLGAVSLFAYALGQGLILIVLGVFTGLVKQMAVLRQVGDFFQKLSAVMIILAGLVLMGQGARWFGWFS